MTLECKTCEHLVKKPYKRTCGATTRAYKNVYNHVYQKRISDRPFWCPIKAGELVVITRYINAFKCEFKRTRADVLEKEFVSYLKAIKPNKDILNLFEAVILQNYGLEQSERIKEGYRLEKDLEKIKKDKKDK